MLNNCILPTKYTYGYMDIIRKINSNYFLKQDQLIFIMETL